MERKNLATRTDFSAIVESPNSPERAKKRTAFIEWARKELSQPGALHAELLAKNQIKGHGTCTSLEIVNMKRKADELKLKLPFEG